MTNYSYKTTLVTVTYSDRIRYLRDLLRRTFDAEGIGNAIIVSNASCSQLEELEHEWGERLRIIRLDSNTGSANGYAMGIEFALNSGAEYIWLMDDDNAPSPGALEKLHLELEKLTVSIGKARVAVVGFRPDQFADIAMGVPPNKVIPPRSSFLGVHFLQIPYKIWRRLPWGKPHLKNLPETIVVPYSPYGGLLAPREVFEAIGLPKKDLVLYADDMEYTWRLTKMHGTLCIVTNALLEDLDESWYLQKKTNNVFECFLMGSPDFRVYYLVRNLAYFNYFLFKISNIQYTLNKLLFMTLLHYFAWRYNKKQRLCLLKKAIFHGETAHLGVNAEFTLDEKENT